MSTSDSSRMTDATPTAEMRIAQEWLLEQRLQAASTDKRVRSLADMLHAHAAQAVAEDRERIVRLFSGEQWEQAPYTRKRIIAAIRAGQPGQET